MSENDRSPKYCSTLVADSLDFRTADEVSALARSLFGSEAATAVAFCGIDAYLIDEELNFRMYVKAFHRLQN